MANKSFYRFLFRTSATDEFSSGNNGPAASQRQSAKYLKQVSLLLLLWIAAIPAPGQSFGLGPKAGLNLSNFSGGNIRSKILAGYHIGGVLNFGIGRVLSIQPEVLFSTQGGKVTNDGFKSSFRMHYIAVPVMVKIKASGGFYLELGPQFSYRSSESTPDLDLGKLTKSLDLSAALGMGYQSASGFGLGARYLAGLSRVGDFSGKDISPDFRNSVFQFSLFWIFH